MKATLEFNLPDDQEDFTLANNAINFWKVLYDLDQELRAKTKYAPDDMPKDVYIAYTHIRERLHELMNESNISFDMVN
jgi:hypothetical protein